MIIRKALRILLISILGAVLLSGCTLLSELLSEAEPTASPTPTPTETETTGAVELTFVPAPEPDIFINKTRGETVARIQRRLKDLGYFNYRPTGYYLATTIESMKAFQQANELDADGSAGEETIRKLFQVQDTTSIVRKNTSSIPGAESPETKEPSQFGALTQWESVNQLIPKGEKFTVDDLRSEHTLQMERTGGDNHIHAEPCTQEDTEQLNAMFSKVVTGEKRPVLVKFEGAVIAASMYGAPHGNDGVTDNAMDGYICIYF